MGYMTANSKTTDSSTVDLQIRPNNMYSNLIFYIARTVW